MDDEIEKYNYHDELEHFTKWSNDNDSKDIYWLSSKEIFGEYVKIIPRYISFEDIEQGEIGDCYLISSIEAISTIPQLLYVILNINETSNTPNGKSFNVSMFIDGKKENIVVEDSFPIYYEDNQIKHLFCKANKNALFVMILEKAWAQINGGYENIKGGQMNEVFEIFLGCGITNLNKDDPDLFFKEIHKNIQSFCTLLVCSDSDHMYSIKDISERNNNKFIILSNPHRTHSKFECMNLDRSGISKKDEENYEKGLIELPIKYFLDWVEEVSCGTPFYGAKIFPYQPRDEDLLKYFCFEIKLEEDSTLVIQICFKNYRAHRTHKTVDFDRKFSKSTLKIITGKNIKELSKRHDSFSIHEYKVNLKKEKSYIFIHIDEINENLKQFSFNFLVKEKVKCTINLIKIFSPHRKQYETPNYSNKPIKQRNYTKLKTKDSYFSKDIIQNFNFFYNLQNIFNVKQGENYYGINENGENRKSFFLDDIIQSKTTNESINCLKVISENENKKIDNDTKIKISLIVKNKDKAKIIKKHKSFDADKKVRNKTPINKMKNKKEFLIDKNSIKNGNFMKNFDFLLHPNDKQYMNKSFI